MFLVKSATGTVLALETDVADPYRVQAVVDRCVLHFGRIDALVNNARRFE